MLRRLQGTPFYLSDASLFRLEIFSCIYFLHQFRPEFLAFLFPLVAEDESIQRKTGKPLCSLKLRLFREVGYIPDAKISNGSHMGRQTERLRNILIMNDTYPSYSQGDVGGFSGLLILRNVTGQPCPVV